jgi:riboflavin synthase
MFTGIVQSVVRVRAVSTRDGELAIELGLEGLIGEKISLGDSVSVNGVCLTVARLSDNCLAFDVSRETLTRTHLGKLSEGNRVNLELAMSVGDRFGGHLVSGHVDGLGTLVAKEPAGRSTRMRFRAPRALAPLIAEKGSVTVDGVSLTVNRVDDSSSAVEFELNLVPHTLTATTLGELQIDHLVHIEVDLVARYLKRLQECDD